MLVRRARRRPPDPRQRLPGVGADRVAGPARHLRRDRGLDPGRRSVRSMIDDETLALDLIDALGPDGSFLEAEHTIDHYRERWYPSLIDRLSHSAWLARGGATLGSAPPRGWTGSSRRTSRQPLPEAADQAIRRSSSGPPRSPAGPSPEPATGRPSRRRDTEQRSNHERRAVRGDVASPSSTGTPTSPPPSREQALDDGVPPLDADRRGPRARALLRRRAVRHGRAVPAGHDAGRPRDAEGRRTSSSRSWQAQSAQRNVAGPRRHRHGQGRHPRDRQEPRGHDAVHQSASRSTTSASTSPRTGSSRRPGSTTPTSSACRRC